MTIKNYSINNQAQAIIYYDGTSPFLLELKDDVEQVLSQSLPTQLKHVTGGASTMLPVLEIILASASTTIMTSILSKFGEDIYNYVKSKMHKKPPEDDSPLILLVKIFTDDMAISGDLILKDRETMVDVTKAIQQMINDAQNIEIEQISLDAPAYLHHGGEFIPLVKSGLQFDYEYNTENKRWVLRKIRKMKST